MKIDVDRVSGSAFPDFHETLGRINILLGANGSGKSQLLHKIVSEPQLHFGPDCQPIFIESNRTYNLPTSIPLVGTEVLDIYRNLEHNFRGFNSSKKQYLAGRVMRAFQIMRAQEHGLVERHSRQCTEWAASDRLSPFPEREPRPVDKFAESFSSIFPELLLLVNEEGHFQIRKHESYYNVDSMSSGERQLFGMLADFSILPSEKYVVLVDEPELNLHPELTLRFWSTIESLLPDSIFLYATHDLAFSMRNTVDKIFVLGFGEIDKADLGKSVDVRPFLGALPGIIRSKKCLLVEGTADSFDSLFYRWILDPSDIAVFPAGNCHEVRSAAARSGVWNAISSGIALAGVIDSDFRETESRGPLLILDFHEAESYFCEPQIGFALYEVLGEQKKVNNDEPSIDAAEKLSLSDFENLIVSHCKSKLLQTVARRVSAQCSINLSASLASIELSADLSETDMREALSAAAARELAKGTTLFDPLNVVSVFSKEMEKCKRAITEKDITLLLQIFEGKHLIVQIAQLLKQKNVRNYQNSVMKNLKAHDFEFLRSLRINIERLFTSSIS